MTDVVLSMHGVTKHYQALRPLRMQALEMRRGAVLTLMGLDAAAAEIFVGLLTGAVLPDEGDVHLFGRSTRDVADTDAWLQMLDEVGIMTDRAVLIGQFTAEQNMAMPFTLQVDPIAEEVRPRVGRLAAEVGLDPAALQQPICELPPQVVARVRLARALALGPTLVIAEHPSASLPPEAVRRFGADMARVARTRGLAVLSVTADRDFARAIGGHTVTHEPATGALRAPSAWRKIFG